MNSVPTTLLLVGSLVASACSNPQRPTETQKRSIPTSEATSEARSPSPAEAGPKKSSPRDELEPFAFLKAEDRSAEDLDLDRQRKPRETLSFFGIQAGMRVADLAAGGGYTTELLALTVGPTGKVYGQNSPFILKRFAETPWSERLAKPQLKNVVRIDSEFDAPLGGEAVDLDAALMVLFYHDTVWFKTDRAAMNKSVFAALKPGGFFGVIDHRAKTGDGISQAQTLHRIEESVVIAEVEAAGFTLEASGTFLDNPDDARNWNASPSQAGEKRGTSDRFVLLFRKPNHH